MHGRDKRMYEVQQDPKYGTFNVCEECRPLQDFHVLHVFSLFRGEAMKCGWCFQDIVNEVGGD